MKVVFAARRLNPGQYEAFRKAWEPPERFPEGFARAYIVRDMNDPDVVITFGLFEVSDERADQLKTELEPSERARHEAMAPYVAETLVAGLFDVVHRAGGLRDRARNARAAHRAAAAAGRLRLHGRGRGRASSGRMPPELVHSIAMSETGRPEHLIQLGIFRTDDPAGCSRAAGRPRADAGRDRAPRREHRDRHHLRDGRGADPCPRLAGRLVAQEPDRNLALELVRVTEAAALACARWVGLRRQDRRRPRGGRRDAAHAGDGRDGRRGRDRRGREGRGADALQRRAHRHPPAASPSTSRSIRWRAPSWSRAASPMRWPWWPPRSRARCSTRGRASTWRSSPAARTSTSSSTSTRRSRRRSR